MLITSRTGCKCSRAPEGGLEVVVDEWFSAGTSPGKWGQGLPGIKHTAKVVSRIREVNFPPHKALRLKWIR